MCHQGSVTRQNPLALTKEQLLLISEETFSVIKQMENLLLENKRGLLLIRGELTPRISGPVGEPSKN